jgi:WD40 repeat protein
VIFSIAFSPDRARVAVGPGGANGIRVYDWSTGKELLADHDYADSAYGLAFAPDGSLVASSDDGQLRRYARADVLHLNSNGPRSRESGPLGTRPHRLSLLSPFPCRTIRSGKFLAARLNA